MLWVPAIHKLDGRRESFHSLDDIARAAGNRMGGMVDDWYILRNFIHVTRLGVRRGSEKQDFVSSLEFADEYGRRVTIFSNKENKWLEAFTTIKSTVLVPAGWGIKVLEAVDRGAMRVDLRQEKGKVIEVGVRVSGKSFPLNNKK